MINRKRRQSKYYAPQNDNTKHVCDYPGCTKAGEYKAPKDRNLRQYYWFCLEHVQQYNANWNYFGDASFASTNDEQPRQRFRFSSRIKYNFGFDFDGSYNFFENSSSHDTYYINFRLDETERKALKILDISIDNLSVDSLKKAYKKAVKKYHPDVNSQDSSAEIFKIISIAYRSLMSKMTSK